MQDEVVSVRSDLAGSQTLLVVDVAERSIHQILLRDSTISRPIPDHRDELVDGGVPLVHRNQLGGFGCGFKSQESDIRSARRLDVKNLREGKNVLFLVVYFLQEIDA